MSSVVSERSDPWRQLSLLSSAGWQLSILPGQPAASLGDQGTVRVIAKRGGREIVREGSSVARITPALYEEAMRA